MSTTVFGWNDDEKCAIYLRLPERKYKKTSQLFYDDNHYSTVRNVSTLMRTYLGDNARHFCPYCTFHHRTENALKTHMKNCKDGKLTIEKMPGECAIAGFTNWKEIVFKPHAGWADMECALEKISVKKGNKTELTHKHNLSGYCYDFVRAWILPIIARYSIRRKRAMKTFRNILWNR